MIQLNIKYIPTNKKNDTIVNNPKYFSINRFATSLKKYINVEIVKKRRARESVDAIIKEIIFI